MLAQMKLQLHFYSLGINNRLKHVPKNIIELAAASVSCLSQLLCCPLLLVPGFVVNWKAAQLPPADTHTEFTRGSYLTRTEFLTVRSAGVRGPLSWWWCSLEAALTRATSGSSRSFTRRRPDYNDFIEAGEETIMILVKVDHLNHKKRSVVSVRVRKHSEMEKVKAFIQRQRKSTFSHLYQLRKLSPAECRQSGEEYGTNWFILSRLQRD